jgi:hypothetical protein
MIAVIFTPSKLIRACDRSKSAEGRRKIVRKKTPEPLTSLGPRSVERWQCPGGDNDMFDFERRVQSLVEHPGCAALQPLPTSAGGDKRSLSALSRGALDTPTSDSGFSATKPCMGSSQVVRLVVAIPDEHTLNTWKRVRAPRALWGRPR